MSRKVLAERLGVPQYSLKRWELGAHALPMADLVNLLEVLEVSFEELVLGHRAPALPAGQRNELAICLNRLVRAAKPLLQLPEKKDEK